MRPADKNKTTFICHRGTYRFPRMPFGLCNAPATFQRLVDTVLMGLNFEVCLAYLDDIIVFNRDLDSHFERLEILFQRLREAQLKLKPSQCQMLRKQVSFRGYTVSQAGVGTDPDSRRRQRLACPAAKSPPKPCFCGPLQVLSTVCT